ncbi:ABC transporter permease [Aerococcaceae bacterium INB8]|uniref:ABC transporter permease n=1 Tax=Ruoffia halotolerans TaxID=2748684 RepID=A0A839A553_9LACT|nr:ABC transporter permease [Ruoffia halotolerans]MBA5728735.1 ABC transporter permease [Ruoffia halotolerans]
MSIYFSAVYQGILWGIMGLGLYISFRILRFADLTSEASFTLGAASAVTLITMGVNPIIATFASIITGMLAGLVTGILTTYFDIPALLASIISLTGFYSINLRVMGSPNLSLRGFNTIYSYLSEFVESVQYQRAIVGLIVVLLVIFFMTYLFKTDLGQAIIATGDNEIMAASFGIKTNTMKRLALMFANGFIALSGALVAQDNGFSDVQMGTGTVVVAMSSIVIGEVIFRKQMKLSGRFISIVVGSVIYRLIIVFVLQLGFNPNDFRLISALVLAIFLALPAISKKMGLNKAKLGKL